MGIESEIRDALTNLVFTLSTLCPKGACWL